MPIYEYVCPQCNVRFDRLQPTGTSHAECPDCGLPSKKALSLFSAFVSTDGATLQSPLRGWVAVADAPAAPVRAARPISSEILYCP